MEPALCSGNKTTTVIPFARTHPDIIQGTYSSYIYNHPDSRTVIPDKVVLAIKRNNIPATMDYLSGKNPVNCCLPSGDPLICFSAVNSSREMLSEILNSIPGNGNGADIFSPFGKTALHEACACGLSDNVKTLLDSGKCNPARKSVAGKTPLMIVSENGHAEIVKIFASAKYASQCGINFTDNFGLTALMIASGKGFVDVVSILVSVCECDISKETYEGETALSIASSRGFGDVVDILIAHGTKTTGPSIERAFFFACSLGFTSVVSRLCRAGVSPNISIAGKTAVVKAILRGNGSVVRNIFDIFRKKNRPDLIGKTLRMRDSLERSPLDCAIETGDEKTAEFLMRETLNAKDTTYSDAPLSILFANNEKLPEKIRKALAKSLFPLYVKKSKIDPDFASEFCNDAKNSRETWLYFAPIPKIPTTKSARKKQEKQSEKKPEKQKPISKQKDPAKSKSHDEKPVVFTTVRKKRQPVSGNSQIAV